MEIEVEIEPIPVWEVLEPRVLRDEAPEDAPLVIACGPGLGRHARVLAHRAVDVVTTGAAQTALRIACHTDASACIVAHSAADGRPLDLLAALRAQHVPVPCVVSLPRRTWEHAEVYLDAGAIAVVEPGDVEGLLSALEDKLGLRASHDPRAPFSAQVEVELGGAWHVVRATDLRPTGLALAGLGHVRPGERVHLHFRVRSHALDLLGRVARTWADPEGPTGAAVEFLDLPSQARAWLRRAIETARRRPLEAAEPGELNTWRSEVRALFPRR